MAEAIGRPPGSTVTVEGFLVEDDGTLMVADLLAESYPPQPGGAVLAVEGPGLDRLAEAAAGTLHAAGPIRWLDQPTTVTGTVEGDRLVVAEPDDSGG